jgi:hypothetical protein
MDELENDAYTESEIILENSKYLIVMANGPISAKYFGGDRFAGGNWGSVYRNGDLYFIIDKENRENSASLFIPNYGSMSIMDNDQNYLEFESLIEMFPSLESKLMTIINPFGTSTYRALKAIAMGIEPENDYVLGQLDPMIYKLFFDKNKPEKSKITLSFNNNSDYFELFDLGDQGQWYVSAIFDHYGNGYDFVDWDDDYQWKEGYVLYDFNDENKQKVNDILKYIAPNLTMDGESETNMKIAVAMDEFFPKISQDIYNEYNSETNNGKNAAQREEIKDELCDIFRPYGLMKLSCFYKYITTVRILIKLFERYGTNMTLEEVLKELGHSIEVQDFYEYAYEVEAYEHFDGESFNRSVSYSLDKIIDELEDSDNFLNMAEFKEIVREVNKKYVYTKRYAFPKDKTRWFEITTIDPKTNLLNIRTGCVSGGCNIKYTDKTLEDFYTLIYHPELFKDE